MNKLEEIKNKSDNETLADNLLQDVYKALEMAEKSLRYKHYDGGRVPVWEYVDYLKRRYE